MLIFFSLSFSRIFFYTGYAASAPEAVGDVGHLRAKQEEKTKETKREKKNSSASSRVGVGESNSVENIRWFLRVVEKGVR